MTHPENETLEITKPDFLDTAPLHPISFYYDLCHDADMSLLIPAPEAKKKPLPIGCPIKRDLKIAISNRYFMAGAIAQGMMDAVPALRQREFPLSIGIHLDLIKNHDVTKVILDGPEILEKKVPLSLDKLIKARIKRFLSIRTKDNDYLAAIIMDKGRMDINGNIGPGSSYENKGYAKARLLRRLEKRMERGQKYPDLYAKAYRTQFSDDFVI